MLRILRAFAWMRWRVFVNTLEKTTTRDKVQRVSLAIERLAPMALAVLLIPSAIALAGLSAFAGVQIASGAERSIAFEAVRFLLLAGTVIAILGPMMMPAADRTNPVRFLLLPIPVRALYVAQAGATLADPWIALMLPAVLAMPVGLLIGGSVTGALLAAAAAILFVLTAIGVSSLTTTLVHLLLRDRRRGELVALVMIIFLPMIGFLPSVLGGRHERRRAAAQEQTAPRERPLPAWLVSAGSRGFAVVPSELYATAVRRAARQDVSAAATGFTALLGVTAAVHAMGFVLFRRVLGLPGTTRSRRAASTSGLWTRVLPGVSPQTSAVALALLRLALRTPRGRAIFLLPVAVTILFTLVMTRSSSFTVGPFPTRSGVGFGAFTSFLALLASLPISMNQFAVDRAGLTMTLLSPLTTRQILTGKAIGTGLVSLPPVAVCLAMAAVAFPGDAPPLWIALALSILATYVLTSPFAATLSILFPRIVNLNSIGSDSNAHGVAGLAGVLCFAAAALPCAALIFAATALFDRLWLAPAFLLIWCAAAFGIARLLFRPAEVLFEKRRENLAMLI